MIYKVFRPDEHAAFVAAGETAGSPADRADGFVHLSTAAQLPGTLARHFAGEDGLLLLALPDEMEGLRWEPSRGGALFPHLYRPLRAADVAWTRPVADGLDDLT